MYSDKATATNLLNAPEDIKAQIIDKDRDKGYKETTITYLNPKCQVISNSDIPINEEIAAALDMILHQIKCARIDRSVDDISAWMRKRQEKSPHRIGNGRKSKIFT